MNVVHIAVLAVVEAHTAMIPAVAKLQSEDILATREHIRNVVGLILQTFVVGCPARSEQSIANLLAIERSLIETVCGNVHYSRSDLLFECERFTQKRRAVILQFRLNPLCLPLIL